VSITQQSLVLQPRAAAFVGYPALLRASSDSRISPSVLSSLQSKAQAHVLVSCYVPEFALSALQYDHPNRALAHPRCRSSRTAPLPAAAPAPCFAYRDGTNKVVRRVPALVLAVV
jgi:hypothetical protein